MRPLVPLPLAAARCLAGASSLLAAVASTLRGEDLARLCAVSFSLPPAAPSAESAPATPSAADLEPFHDLARSLWDDYAPEELKEEYALLPPEELAPLLQRLIAAGQSENLAEVAGFSPGARSALSSLRARPGFNDYAAWLNNQLDEIEAAGAAQARPPPLFVPQPAPAPPRLDVPYFDLWLERIAERPRPERAERYLPTLRRAFAAEGLPTALVWLAETESSFNPRARSPAGARGLFQLMPETARSLGLGLWPDERTHPAPSARAAAAYLRHLHTRFGDWPLALAAYNAGETRVARELNRRATDNFAAISHHLPVETRFYVPKVLATIQVREGLTPAELPAPERRS